jgi:hypothetical protein
VTSCYGAIEVFYTTFLKLAATEVFSTTFLKLLSHIGQEDCYVIVRMHKVLCTVIVTKVLVKEKGAII